QSFEDAFARLPLHDDAIKAKVVALSILFWKESMKANQDAVDALNNPRIKCAFAPFTEQNAALADDPWVFGVTGLLQPEDPMKDERRVACDASTEDLFKRFFCHRASAGHPNAQGARQFASAIVAVH